MAEGRAGPGLSPSPWFEGEENPLVLLRLVVLEQLCASARRKLGQLQFWVLSQRVGVELARLLLPLLAGDAGKLFLVPFWGWQRGAQLGLWVAYPGAGLSASRLFCLAPCKPGNASVPLVCSRRKCRKKFMFTVSRSPCLVPTGSPELLGLVFALCPGLWDAWGSASLLSFTKVSSYGTDIFLWPQVCAERSNVNSQRCLLRCAPVQYPCVLPTHPSHHLHPWASRATWESKLLETQLTAQIQQALL